ncbi:threonine/serine dehydratase [Roseibium sp. CAU 1637]|uniref:Threonine/serine dehydratase n=1 Tax=Roseibium limicola TaxID=2816037 RepID=A0A939J6V1_9HYPH|nr:threonine/serine dehydratase [Roseibium limicola]MBO0343596.1 threonine/serine dehydratase [Roseibium limicola]
MSSFVRHEDILEARDGLRGHAVETPLLRSPILDEITGATVLIKPECLQRTGSFKFRGAYTALRRIPEAERSKGVVACSSGNHAQGIAAAARIFGVPATIVMPADAPAIKLRRTAELGAKVVTYDRASEDREAIANRICAETGARFVHPFNDASVIAGQGTVGLEIAQQATSLGLAPDAVLACTGGGGLSAGIALALSHELPAVRFYPVEPEGFDDYGRSLLAGKRLANERLSGSVCDALLTEMPGEIGFAILSSLKQANRLGHGLVVSDAEALEAVRFAFQELKLVVEPGGAVALAALLSGKADFKSRTVAVVLTGGNLDGTLLAGLV